MNKPIEYKAIVTANSDEITIKRITDPVPIITLSDFLAFKGRIVEQLTEQLREWVAGLMPGDDHYAIFYDEDKDDNTFKWCDELEDRAWDKTCEIIEMRSNWYGTAQARDLFLGSFYLHMPHSTITAKALWRLHGVPYTFHMDKLAESITFALIVDSIVTKIQDTVESDNIDVDTV